MCLFSPYLGQAFYFFLSFFLFQQRIVAFTVACFATPTPTILLSHTAWLSVFCHQSHRTGRCVQSHTKHSTSCLLTIMSNCSRLESYSASRRYLLADFPSVVCIELTLFIDHPNYGRFRDPASECRFCSPG